MNLKLNVDDKTKIRMLKGLLAASVLGQVVMVAQINHYVKDYVTNYKKLSRNYRILYDFTKIVMEKVDITPAHQELDEFITFQEIVDQLEKDD